MNEKIAFLATELDLPPASEGNLPVPLIRVSVRPEGVVRPEGIRADGVRPEAGDGTGPIVPSRVQEIGASERGSHPSSDQADVHAARQHSAEGAADDYSDNESVTRAVSPNRREEGPKRGVSQPAALVVGDIVAEKYSVGPVIGAGGMGIVYKARHIELGTWVAIKVIRPDIAQNSSL
jgi:hypothetical protein